MKKFSSISLFLVFSVVISLACTAQDGKWTKLFNGKNLDGWSIHSGTAKYRVENGEIIGTSVPNSPNTFLCTDREYGDFILEFEVYLVSPELNSGVQFRSQIAKGETMFWFRDGRGEYRTNTIPADRVYGYQVEIAEAGKGSAGGVYDEARRAMVNPWWPEKGSEASKAFKNDQWNKYRVECRGDAMKTIVNGVVVTDFRDGLSPKGVIGLQVHDVGPDTTPYEVKWRNIRLMELD